ncbi:MULTISPECIES: TetR family transcriptional regulator [unclassified Ensifer]|uniref:TetR family transcriptional regulator n=1 Tax=unclassified Ensifer TaxID=2633371 RepID=UPI000708F04A|nr:MULTISPECIES: TetR family transcriptional regulator [unclassified Ensifer]KQW46831.1 TetR family transcriptional regulator [Ensifer sp. Root1252]KQW78482.1 TetR family transcriptional regulator [Ensifer sp. Root127]KRC69386.1 TetR family transcriptional regulator [Ensifer sp. Root231]KRC96662.1 TetR family transcriptional regulator [Ensifer sp. Root258]
MEKREQVSRKNDPERTRENILAVATEEFAAHGLAGARVDAIAERTRTSKRMIYYYFISKEDLYLAVLEKAYRKIRSREADLQLTEMQPVAALRTLISNTFDYDENHPDFVRLVSGENILLAAHMRRSTEIADLNVSIIRTLTDILERGKADGSFQREIDAIDLHLLISAFCFFRVSNAHTFSTIFQRNLSETSTYERHKKMIADAVITYLRLAI